MSKAKDYRFFASMSLAIDAALLLPFLLAAVLIVAFLFGANPAGAAEGPKQLIAVTQFQGQNTEAQNVDATGAVPETEEMSQQHNLDRRAKMVGAMNNTAKKQSDTQQAIIQNIK